MVRNLYKKEREWYFVQMPKKELFLNLIDYIFNKIESFELELLKDINTLKLTKRHEDMIKELKPYIIEEHSHDEIDNGIVCSKIQIYNIKANEITKKIFNKYISEELYNKKESSSIVATVFTKDKEKPWIGFNFMYRMNLIWENDIEVIKELENISGVEIRDFLVEEDDSEEDDSEEYCTIRLEEVKAISELIKNKNYYIIDSCVPYDEDKVSLNDLIEFGEFLEKSNVYNYNAPITTAYISNRKFFEEGLTDSNFKYNFNGKQFQAIDCMLLDDKYFKNIGLRLCKGSFEGKDSSAIPVVLGYAFRDLVEIHDKIPYVFYNEKEEEFIGNIEVCGIIDKESFVIKNGDEVSLENTERLIVTNSSFGKQICIVHGIESELEKRAELYSLYYCSYYDFKDESQKTEVEEYSKKLGLNFKFIPMKESLKLEMKNY